MVSPLIDLPFQGPPLNKPIVLPQKWRQTSVHQQREAFRRMADVDSYNGFVQAMLNDGMDPNMLIEHSTLGQDDQKPVLWAALEHRAWHNACALLAHGANPDQSYKESVWCALAKGMGFQKVSIEWSVGLVKNLLACGAPVNIIDREGVKERSPLSWACMYRRYEWLPLLLEAGADPHSCLQDGRGLLHDFMAWREFEPEWGQANFVENEPGVGVSRLEEGRQWLWHFLALGVDPNQKTQPNENRLGITPLDLAKVLDASAITLIEHGGRFGLIERNPIGYAGIGLHNVAIETAKRGRLNDLDVLKPLGVERLDQFSNFNGDGVLKALLWADANVGKTVDVWHAYLAWSPTHRADEVDSKGQNVWHWAAKEGDVALMHEAQRLNVPHRLDNEGKSAIDVLCDMRLSRNEDSAPQKWHHAALTLMALGHEVNDETWQYADQKGRRVWLLEACSAWERAQLKGVPEKQDVTPAAQSLAQRSRL